MKLVACTVAPTLLVVVLGAVSSGFQEPQGIEQDAQEFMQRKLDASRDVVEGLATEDFEKIERSAQVLMLLSHESEWKVIQTQRYLDMSAEFRSSAERLRDSAKAQNLDGATLGYFEVTLNCVRCHRYVRNNE